MERLKIEPPPVDPAGFRGLWERFGAPGRLVLAVSGGGDSVALMRLAAPLHTGGLADIHVATVDHGLRPEAREEAEIVALEARKCGLAHSILAWTGAKPSSGLQAAARNARYRLLASYAVDMTADAIMTAHTADDQAETVLMRLARGSGPRGLSGMAEETLIAAGAGSPVRLLRPLLGHRRSELRAYLDEIRAPFVDDPSNQNPAFERVRVRRMLALLERDGLTVDALNQTAAASRIAAARLESWENERFHELAGRFDEWGGASIDAAHLAIEDASLTARLIQAVGGGDYLPGANSTRNVLATILAGREATLAGATLRPRQGLVRVWRESAAVLGRAEVSAIAPIELCSGERVLWDNRFIVGNPFDHDASLRPLGGAAKKIAISKDKTEALSLASAPGLWVDGDLVAVPGEGGEFTPLAEERFFRRINRFHENCTIVKTDRGAALP